MTSGLLGLATYCRVNVTTPAEWITSTVARPALLASHQTALLGVLLRLVVDMPSTRQLGRKPQHTPAQLAASSQPPQEMGAPTVFRPRGLDKRHVVASVARVGSTAPTPASAWQTVPVVSTRQSAAVAQQLRSSALRIVLPVAYPPVPTQVSPGEPRHPEVWPLVEPRRTTAVA